MTVELVRNEPKTTDEMPDYYVESTPVEQVRILKRECERQIANLKLDEAELSARSAIRMIQRFLPSLKPGGVEYRVLESFRKDLERKVKYAIPAKRGAIENGKRRAAALAEAAERASDLAKRLARRQVDSYVDFSMSQFPNHSECVVFNHDLGGTTPTTAAAGSEAEFSTIEFSRQASTEEPDEFFTAHFNERTPSIPQPSFAQVTQNARSPSAGIYSAAEFTTRIPHYPSSINPHDISAYPSEYQPAPSLFACQEEDPLEFQSIVEGGNLHASFMTSFDSLAINSSIRPLPSERGLTSVAPSIYEENVLERQGSWALQSAINSNQRSGYVHLTNRRAHFTAPPGGGNLRTIPSQPHMDQGIQ